MSYSDLLCRVAVRGCLIVPILALPIASYAQEVTPESVAPAEKGEAPATASQASQASAADSGKAQKLGRFGSLQQIRHRISPASCFVGSALATVLLWAG